MAGSEEQEATPGNYQESRWPVDDTDEKPKVSPVKMVLYVVIGVPIVLGVLALALIVTSASGEGIGFFLMLVFAMIAAVIFKIFIY